MLFDEEESTSLPSAQDINQEDETPGSYLDGVDVDATDNADDGPGLDNENDILALYENELVANLDINQQPSDETSKAVVEAANALYYRMKPLFDEGVLYFVGGFALRAKGGPRTTTDVDLEVSQSKFVALLGAKVESCGFNVSKLQDNGFNALDKASGIKINVRVRTFQGVERFSENYGGYSCVCDDIQLIQKLNALPNRRDVSKQRFDLVDIDFLLSRNICFRKELAGFFSQKENLMQAVKSGRIYLPDGTVKTFIERLESQDLDEVIDDTMKTGHGSTDEAKGLD
ncbi:hypothetical protein TWF506_004756 [Arthrobotrys conoides]|uniref:Uncharacterized protein n=1 Tax=Arthrobotrys conoides TaxID=74498 RepID=A0AAN8RPB3_9PEZI